MGSSASSSASGSTMLRAGMLGSSFEFSKPLFSLTLEGATVSDLSVTSGVAKTASKFLATAGAAALALAAFTIAEDPTEGSGFGSASFNSGVLSSAALSSAILGSASFGSADASFGSERLSVGFGSETCAAGVLTGRVGASAGFSGIGMGENVAFGTAGTARTGGAVATGATG